MNKLIYYCSQEGNTCDKKEQCQRYIGAIEKDINKTSLYKVACTQANNRVLFMQTEKKGENNNEESQNTTT